jgi:hypothetical protein
MNPSAIAADLLQDRTITVGGMFSFPTFFGGITLAEANQWVGFYAVCVGAIGSTLVVIYTALKIIRMAGDKSAKE